PRVPGPRAEAAAEPGSQSQTHQMSDKPTIADLLAADPRDPGCAAGFEMLSVYADLELAGEDAAARFPGIAAHLRSCPACREDHDGILPAARIQRTPGGGA